MSIKVKQVIVRIVTVIDLIAAAHMFLGAFFGSPLLPANTEANRDIIAIILIVPVFVFGFVLIALLFIWRNDLDEIFPDKPKR